MYNVTLEQLSLYDSEIMDDYLKDFSYNQIVSQPRVLSVNGTYYEILTFKVYETSEEAALGINPKSRNRIQFSITKQLEIFL